MSEIEQEMDRLVDELMRDRSELRNFINEVLWDEDHDDEYLEGLADDLQASRVEMTHFVQLAMETE